MFFPSYRICDHEAELFLLTPQQVEDTLNNSNELFLTFRKEMEEMSKKTKMLEKENSKLTRKHEQTKSNILEMAQERERDRAEIDKLRKAETKMRAIIKNMQEQGRGIPQPFQQELIDEEGTESEYDEEYEDDEEGDEDGVYEVEDDLKLAPPAFGTVPPAVVEKANGVQQAAIVNGLKH